MEERSAGSFDDHLDERLLHHRIVVLGSQVDDVSANRVCSQLLLLAAEDPGKDVTVYINSPGGSVYAGMAIYDTMRLLPCDVGTLGAGMAASMGQFLLCAGAEGKRRCLPNARVMMHQPSAGIGGTAADVEIQARSLGETKRLMHELTAHHTGQPVETVIRDSDRDRWFTAEQAKEYGMVDEVVSSLAPLVGGRARKVGL
jgi:ATP-dependent Clp protease protease subunit